MLALSEAIRARGETYDLARYENAGLFLLSQEADRIAKELADEEQKCKDKAEKKRLKKMVSSAITERKKGGAIEVPCRAIPIVSKKKLHMHIVLMKKKKNVYWA